MPSLVKAPVRSAPHFRNNPYFYFMPTVHIIIKGKVQGVFFRATAKDKAEAFEVTGKVRNTEEGHVEIWASGTDDQLKVFLEWCTKGPSRARVDDIWSETAPDQDFDGFEVIRS